MNYKIIFPTLLLFSSMSQATERVIYGNFIDAIDNKYSFYTRDLKDLIQDISSKNYHLTVTPPQSIGPKGNLINRNLSFSICDINLNDCLEIPKEGITLNQIKINNSMIKIMFPNEDVDAGSYSTNFILSLTSLEE